MIDSVRGFFGIVFLLGFAILFHEFGHFLWAKICGVRVLKFSIGFGKFIFSWKRGGTGYRVAWFPIGGYVMLHGAMNPETGEPMKEEPESATGEGQSGPPPAEKSLEAVQAAAAGNAGGNLSTAGDAPRSGGLKRMVDAATSDSTALYNKPYLQKLAIYGGGVVMNWITAVVAVGLIYAIGFDASKPAGNVVGRVEPPAGVEASALPLEPGDTVLKANGKAIANWDDFLESMGDAWESEKKTGEPKSVEVVIERPGKGEETVTLPTTFEVKGERASSALFIAPHRPAYVEDIIPNKPADKAGVKRGDIITAINGEAVHGWNDMAAIVQKSAGRPLEIVVKRGDQSVSMTVTPVTDPNNEEKGQIGIVAGSPDREFRREPVLTAFYKAPQRTVRTTVVYIELFGGVVKRLADFRFRAVGDELGGPIQIAQLAYRSAKRGLIDFLWLFFSFNIALAVFNILPIPLLDGSLLFFATYEAIVGKPLPPKLHIPLLYAGLVLIVILFVVVSVNDVWRVWG